MAMEISDAQFRSEVEEHKGTVFVDFWAPWCGPCVMMAPIFEKASKKYTKIKFLKVNTVENIENASRYGVTGIPCVIIFKDGKEVERLIGLQPEQRFDAVAGKYSR